MNLLITGGAGFIGSNLIHHVIDDARIVKLVNLDCLTYAGHPANLEKVSKHPKYVFEKVDLRDKAATLRVVEQHAITHVMHLAAESHVDRSITGPGDFIQTNIVGTFNLLEACREVWLNRQSATGNRQFRFHHVSTDEVYGSLGATGYFTETTPYAPNSPYSSSKASSDFLVRAYHHTYGLDTVITNCSNNYGPFQFPEKLIPVIIQNVLPHVPGYHYTTKWFVISAIAISPVVVLFCSASYLLIERPLIALGHQVSKRKVTSIVVQRDRRAASAI